MSVKFVHGLHEPFPILVEALEKGQRMPDVEFDGPDQGVARLEMRQHIYGAALWLAAPRGRGRHALHADLTGKVRPNIQIRKIYVGSPGVVVDPLDSRALDMTGWMIREGARGFVRVDHLKDADGEPLGLPDEATKRGRDSYTEWCRRLLDPTRLQQLQEELSKSEEGRTLVAGWRPLVAGFVKETLERPGNKSEGRRKHDAETLASIEGQMGKAADIIDEALAAPSETTTPKRGSNRGSRR